MFSVFRSLLIYHLSSFLLVSSGLSSISFFSGLFWLSSRMSYVTCIGCGKVFLGASTNVSFQYCGDCLRPETSSGRRSSFSSFFSRFNNFSLSGCVRRESPALPSNSFARLSLRRESSVARQRDDFGEGKRKGKGKVEEEEEEGERLVLTVQERTSQRLVLFWDRDNVRLPSDNPGTFLYDNIQKIFLTAQILTALEIGYLFGLAGSMGDIPTRGVQIINCTVLKKRDAADKKMKQGLRKFTRTADKGIYSILLITGDHYFIRIVKRLQNLGWRIYLVCIEENASRSLIQGAIRTFSWYEMSHGRLKDIKME